MTKQHISTHLLVMPNQIIDGVGTDGTKGMSVKAHHDLLSAKVGQLHRCAIDGQELKVGSHVSPLEKVFGGTPSPRPAATLFPTQTRPRTCIAVVNFRRDGGSAARDAVCGLVIVCHNCNTAVMASRAFLPVLR